MLHVKVVKRGNLRVLITRRKNFSSVSLIFHSIPCGTCTLVQVLWCLATKLHRWECRARKRIVLEERGDVWWPKKLHESRELHKCKLLEKFKYLPLAFIPTILYNLIINFNYIMIPIVIFILLYYYLNIIA